MNNLQKYESKLLLDGKQSEPKKHNAIVILLSMITFFVGVMSGYMVTQDDRYFSFGCGIVGAMWFVYVREIGREYE